MTVENPDSEIVWAQNPYDENRIIGKRLWVMADKLSVEFVP